MNTVWNDLIAKLPGAHLLQTQEWAQVKAPLGWEAYYFLWQLADDHNGPKFNLLPVTKDHLNFTANDDVTIVAAAMVLIRQFSLGRVSTPFKLAYSPKGPLLDWENVDLRHQVLKDMVHHAQKSGALLLKIDPDVLLGVGVPETLEAAENAVGDAVREELLQNGWTFSEDQIQFRNTVIVNLEPDEDSLLKQMKQKTRYNIRLAARKGVKVRQGGREDLELLYRLYAETSVRDGFVIRDESYYQNLWETYLNNADNPTTDAPLAEPLIAEVNGEAIAAVIIFRFARQAWFLFGMSGDTHRKLMPNYLLQWEAMRRAKSAGCTHYDMWGAPDKFDESDSLWGVFRFKQGFQGEVVRTLGAWDLPLRPFQYQLYTRILPAIINRMQARGRSITRQRVDPL